MRYYESQHSAFAQSGMQATQVLRARCVLNTWDVLYTTPFGTPSPLLF